MANASIDALVAAVTAEDTAVQSAIVLINGFSKRVSDAVAAALAGGATAADLAPITAVVADIQAQTNQLATAVAANTGP